MIYPTSKRFLPIYINNSGPQPGPDYSTMPLTFESTGDTAVKINKANLSYKKNDQEWTPYTAYDVISCSNNDVVSFSGTNTSIETKFITSGNGTLEVYGNANSLINYGNVISNCFKDLFNGCSKLVDASNLILPSMSLAYNCYNQMFVNCTSLTAIPLLPATTLDEMCYKDMFYGCTSLSTVPVNLLPATTLARSCYNGMFGRCTSLLSAPALPATELVYQCYNGMFTRCSNLSSINVNFIEWIYDSTDNWVYLVASDGTFNKPTILTREYGVDNIPDDWTIVDK